MINTNSTVKLNEKIVKWCGWEYHQNDTQAQRWFIPKPYNTWTWNCPNFTNSMDAIVKWVIEPNRGFLNTLPKGIINWRISNQEPDVGTYRRPRVWLSYCYLLKNSEEFSKWYFSKAEHDSISIAFCLALEQIIDSV